MFNIPGIYYRVEDGEEKRLEIQHPYVRMTAEATNESVMLAVLRDLGWKRDEVDSDGGDAYDPYGLHFQRITGERVVAMVDCEFWRLTERVVSDESVRGLTVDEAHIWALYGYMDLETGRDLL